MVDDPYLYGQIAAANSLSDVYAMGARPLTAMNVVAFPTCVLGVEVLGRILQGGADKVREAGAIVVGGHSVEDEEPKYGLSVTGLADPRRLVTTVGARPGERLILTKPLGTGLLTTALKGEVLAEADIPEALAGMAQLNRYASEVMLEIGVSACTDITGFGLLGHALEMAQASGVCLVIEGAALPAYPRALEMAAMGLVPEGSYRNRDHYGPQLVGFDSVERQALDLLSDPQTSGGLLLAVPPDRAERLATALAAAGCGSYPIGWVEAEPAGKLQVV